MSAGAGIQAQIGFGDEGTPGTYEAPTVFHEFRDESLKLEVERIPSRGLRAGRRTQHRWASGVQRVTGDINLELPNVGLALLLERLMGGDDSYSGDDPVSGANTHTFNFGDILPDSNALTVQVGRPAIDGTVEPFSYLGCRFTEAELTAEVNDYAMLRLGVYGEHETTSESLETASYPAGLEPFVYTAGSLLVAGSALDVKSFGLTINNNLAIDRHFIRATTPARPKTAVENGVREVTGTMVADFESLTAYQRFVNGTEAALVLAFSQGLVTGSTPYSLTLTLNIRFDGETPNVSGPEMLEQPLPFAMTSATSDADAFTAVLVNDDADPSA